MSDVFAKEAGLTRDDALLANQPPSVTTLRCKIEELLAEMPGLLDMTIGEYFSGQKLSKSAQETVEQYRSSTIHEFTARAIRQPWEPEAAFMRTTTILAMVKRTPRNHLLTLFQLYLFAHDPEQGLP